MNLREKVQNSFFKVKRDIDAIKVSFTDWVLFLKRKNDVLEQKMRMLEHRIAQLESKKQVIIYR